MGRIVHFEIHATDPERAQAFYAALFGWTFQAWGGGEPPYWLITTGPESAPGINGGLLRRMGPPPTHGQPVNAFMCTVSVDDLDGTVARAVGLGAQVALPKMPVPGVGWLAYIHDPDGNILGLMQNDPGAR